MKKGLLYSFFLILVTTHANNMGMRTQTGRRFIKQSLPRKTYTPHTIIHTKTSPTSTMTNRFKQYYAQFQTWLWGPRKTEDIIIYSTYESKSVVVERFIRTLKEMITKYFTKTNSRDWVKILPKFVQIYNNRVHRTIGMTPSNPKNEGLVFMNLRKKPKKFLKKR